MVFLKRSPEGKQAHAFDHYSADEWIAKFRALPQKQIYLKITGGEPFLDRANMLRLLTGLDDSRFRIRIDTNGSWNPAEFEQVNKQQIALNVSYHPHEEASLDHFLTRARRIRDAGFHVAKINYVLAPENIQGGVENIERIEREGFFVNVGAMISLGVYSSRSERHTEEVEVLQRYNTPLDLKYRLENPVTRGRECFHPSFNYYILYDGTIMVYCLHDTRRNWFSDGAPELPRTAVACPAEHCEGCLEMYRALPDEPLNTAPVSMCELDEYVSEVKQYRRAYAWRSRLRAIPGIRSFVPPERTEVRPQSQPDLVQISPANGIKGAVELCHGPSGNRTVRVRDRLSISGFVATAKEISVLFGNHEVGRIAYFHERPDGMRGWKTLIYVPHVDPGTHELRFIDSGECFATTSVEVTG